MTTHSAAPAPPALPSTSARLYNPDLDAIRFLAFLVVFLHHAFPNSEKAYSALGETPARVLSALASSGGFGVDLFFVLSSYLITRLLIAEYVSVGRLQIGRFLARRALRIWPLYYTFLGFCVFVVPLLIPTDQIGRQLPWFLAFLGNWSVAEWGYPKSVAAPLWSVSIEEQFYVFWPLALLLFGVRRLAPMAVALLAIAWGTRFFLWNVGAEHPAVWTNTFARLDPIAAGILLAWLASTTAPCLSRLQSVLLLAAGALALPACVFVLGRDAVAGSGSIILYPAVSLACALLVAAVVWCRTPVFRVGLPLVDRSLVYLGRISYGLYVFHVLAIQLVQLHQDAAGLTGPLARLADVAIALLLTILLAAISYRFLEQPFLELKRRFSVVDSGPR